MMTGSAIQREKLDCCSQPARGVEKPTGSPLTFFTLAN
jgi:hypothetical protein